MTTEHFYAALPGLPQFRDMTDQRHYHALPADWYLLITDVVGSTQAVDAGRYRDVNFLGACSIMAVLNAIHPIDVPFVFGGDGASIAVPPAYLALARDALIGLRYLAHHAYGMDLRVGIVPVSAILPQYGLNVAKVQITPTSTQASFLGGGMSYATDLMKRDPAYRVDVLDAEMPVDLTGMECRWQEVASCCGNTLSLIVACPEHSRRSPTKLYQEVMIAIQGIYGDEQAYHPIRMLELKLSFNLRKLRTELVARSKGLWGRLKYLLKLYMEVLLGWCLMRWHLRIGGVNWSQYKQDVRAASDYQKIDDLLRMVIAGTPEQTEQLQRYLLMRYQRGELLYGLHITDRALVTCLIFDRHNRHLHLVDAADGGYTMAAKMLKAQIAAQPHRDDSRQESRLNLRQRLRHRLRQQWT